jgi:hypothetical protein
MHSAFTGRTGQRYAEIAAGLMPQVRQFCGLI